MHSEDADHEMAWKNNVDSYQNALGLKCLSDMFCKMVIIWKQGMHHKTDNCGVNKFFLGQTSWFQSVRPHQFQNSCGINDSKGLKIYSTL